jgi:hypothetical protein
MASRLGWLFFLVICIGTYSNWRRGVVSPFDLYLRERGWTVPFWVIAGLILCSLFVWLFVEARRLARAKATLQALRAKLAADIAEDHRRAAESHRSCPRHRHLD